MDWLVPEGRQAGAVVDAWTTKKRALEHTRCPAINRKKNPPELSVRFSVHGVARMAIEARLATGGAVEAVLQPAALGRGVPSMLPSVC